MTVRHYWRRAIRRGRPERLAIPPACDAAGTLAMLSREPQPALSWFDRTVAFLTTPFKFLGISGWKETGCSAQAAGRTVRAAQHSTDGFWTIDVELGAFVVGQTPANLATSLYVRLEVEPDTAAHAVCAARPIGQGAALAFGGAVVIDTDGPFLEVHPEEDFKVIAAGSSDRNGIAT